MDLWKISSPFKKKQKKKKKKSSVTLGYNNGKSDTDAQISCVKVDPTGLFQTASRQAVEPYVEIYRSSISVSRPCHHWHTTKNLCLHQQMSKGKEKQEQLTALKILGRLWFRWSGGDFTSHPSWIVSPIASKLSQGLYLSLNHSFKLLTPRCTTLISSFSSGRQVCISFSAKQEVANSIWRPTWRHNFLCRDFLFDEISTQISSRRIESRLL